MFKKILSTILAVITVVSAISLSVSAENDGYTIEQYIYDYYNDIYKENVSSFTKIILFNTERPDDIWHLSNDIDKYDLFKNEISKVDTSYIVQTEKRYFITFKSSNDNLLYLCITENGELFFGRYADYNKPNYCEYIVKNIDNVLDQLSEICEANKTTYKGAPTEKWDFANGTYTESLNGVSSAEGRGYSSKYLSAKANKKYYLEVSNFYSEAQTGAIKFTVKNKNNGMTANDENYMKMEYSFTTDSKGGFTAPMNFGNDTDFYFEITTSDPQTAKIYGTYAIREADKTYFNDTTGHWAEKTINKWADKGIISGYPDGTFKPDNPVTRAELAKVLTLVFELKPSEYVYNKNDLNENDWYYDYLLCAGKYIPNYYLLYSHENNEPYFDNYITMLNSFLPEQNAMRMHTADSIVEIIRNKDDLIIDMPEISIVKEELNKTFKDTEYESLMSDNHGIISDNVRRIFEYTYLANKLGIMQGDTDGYFRPYDNVTRAELITMLDRIIAE